MLTTMAANKFLDYNHFSDYEFLENLLYVIDNCLTGCLRWSPDCKYLKMNFPHFAKEYLSSGPTKCESLHSFSIKMAEIGLIRVNDYHERNPNVITFERIEDIDYQPEEEMMADLNSPDFCFGSVFPKIPVPGKFHRLHDRTGFGYEAFDPDYVSDFYNCSEPIARSDVAGWCGEQAGKRIVRLPRRFMGYYVEDTRRKRHKMATGKSYRTRIQRQQNSTDVSAKQLASRRSALADVDGSTFENSEFLRQILFYEEVDAIRPFVKETSKDVMMSSVSGTDENVLISEKQEKMFSDCKCPPEINPKFLN